MSKTYIKVTPDMGRGLFALQDLPKDKLLFTCELLVLSPEDTLKVNATDLQYYTFKYNETQDCLVLGDGEIFNHGANPNIGYKIIDFDGRRVMAFFTLTYINRDTQLFIDYSADIEIDVLKYNVNLIGDSK